MSELVRAQQATRAQRARVQAKGRVVATVSNTSLDAERRADLARKKAHEDEAERREQERYADEDRRRDRLDQQARAECEAALEAPQRDALDAANAKVEEAWNDVLATNRELIEVQSETATMFEGLNSRAFWAEFLGDSTKVAFDVASLATGPGWAKLFATRGFKLFSFFASSGVGLATDVSSEGGVAYKGARDIAKAKGSGWVKGGAGHLSTLSKGKNALALFDSAPGYGDYGILSDRGTVSELRELIADDPRSFAEKLGGLTSEEIDAQLAKVEQKLDAHDAADARHEDAKRERRALRTAQRQQRTACVSRRKRELGAEW